MKKSAISPFLMALCGLVLACSSDDDDNTGSDCQSICNHMAQVCDDYIGSTSCPGECQASTSSTRSCVQQAQSCGQIDTCLAGGGSDCTSICSHMAQVCDDFIGSTECPNECEQSTESVRVCAQQAEDCGQVYACIGGGPG